jgi:hypothetical protein
LRRIISIALLLLLSGPSWAGPNEALAAASADIRKVPLSDQPFARYFDLSSIAEKSLPDFLAAFVFHINCLSKEADLVKPNDLASPYLVLVTPILLRLEIRSLGWDRKVFDKLIDQPEPYFHFLVDVEEEQDEWFNWPGGKGKDGNDYPAGRYVRKVKVKVRKAQGSAPWLEASQIAGLVERTQSQIPIVRADWFLVQTAANVDRKASYYQFLGIKNERDIAELCGLDVQKAIKIQREIAAIVEQSGVAINNRQIFRYQAIAGGYWETRDAKSSVGKQNAQDNLNGDYDFDAKEVYFSLPNRLWGLAAVQAKDGNGAKAGDLQESVPDFIAHDKKSTSNDLRIHPSISCVRCHVEGLRPIDDWARDFYQIDPKLGGALLTSTDFEKYKRLKRLYLGPLEEDYEADQLIYTRTLARLLGKEWTPEKVAGAYAKVWQEYLDIPGKGIGM